VRHGGGADARDVPAEEGHPRLLEGVVAVLGLAEGLVDGLDGLFEEGELGHGVRDLPAPEGIQPFVKPARVPRQPRKFLSMPDAVLGTELTL
jgi:hypothetical protein